MDPDSQEAARQLAQLALTLYRGLIQDGATEREATNILPGVLTAFLLAGMSQAE